MGTNDYLTTVGPIPNPKSLAFFPWLERRYSYIRNYVNIEGLIEYYFSNSTGNDANDGLTPATAKQTVLEMENTIINNFGLCVLKLKCGDEWNEFGAPSIIFGGVKMTNYGSGNLPWINRFAQKYSTGWTLASGNRWTRPEPADTAWVRPQGYAASMEPSKVLSRQTSAANCEATPNSFFWAANVLHINLGGIDPNGELLEGNANSTIPGIVCNTDLTWIDGIRLSGFGMNAPDPHSAQSYQIQAAQGNDEIVYISNCIGDFGGTHLIAQFQGSGDGAITLIENCSAGFAMQAGAGETIWNTYSSTGLQETYFKNITTLAGTLINGTAAWTRRGISVYGHTAGVGVASLIVVDGHTVVDSEIGVSRLSFFENVPAVTTETDIRAFIINEQATGAFFTSCPYHDNAWINCKYILTPTECAGQSMYASGTTAQYFNGWMWNNTVDINLAGQATTNSRSLYNALTTNNDCRMWHNAFTLRMASTVAWRTDLDTGGVDSSPNCQVFNNIWQSTVAAVATVGMKNNAANLKNNAYYQIVGGADNATRTAYGNDAGKVNLTSQLVITPKGTRSLDRLGYIGINLEYDQNKNRRPTTTASTIGPFDLTLTGDSSFRNRGGDRGRLLFGAR